MARPPIELTQEMQLRLCEALRVGASLQHAAHYAGISEKTLRRWIERGKAEEDTTFGQLLQHIEKAKADLVVSLLLKINHAANKHWKAAAWKLEHLYPHLYGKSAKSESEETNAPHSWRDVEFMARMP